MKISVVLTSYNHEKFIRQSIESVLNQTYQDFEFIIVDDCSTDTSWDIISEYKRKYPAIITMRSECNTGGEIHKDIIRNCTTGDYIAVHHSDDVWMEDKLQRQVNIIQNMPECVAVFSNAGAIDDNGNDYSDKNGFYYDLFSVENRTRQEWLNYFFYHGNCLCHPSILVKKSAYIDDGFSRNGLQQIPDLVKWIQLCKKHEIYVLPESLIKFRVHNDGGNTSGMRAETQMRSATEMFLMLKEYVSIQDKEEFLKIFPNARKYCIGDFFQTEYVLGRICTEEGMPPYARLFGVQLLYDVLNNFQYADSIDKEYHYTGKEFKQENGKYDIFGIVPKAFEQTRSIYYDVGKGYGTERRISQKFTLKLCESFHFICSLDLAEGETLKGLRFDPSEGIEIKAEILHVLINGIQTSAVSVNALYQLENQDIFMTPDPIYHIIIPDEVEGQQCIEIDILGKIERLSDEEMTKVADNMLRTKIESEWMKAELDEGRVELDRRRTELERTRIELDRVKAELDGIKSTKSYRAFKLLKGILESVKIRCRKL
jgi:glycosyltransferase involved in cell wall biosynthesis